MEYQLTNRKVAVLATDGFEQSEMVVPTMALRTEGVTVLIVSLQKGKIMGWNETNWGDSFDVDITIDDADSSDFDMLILPGGVMNSDTLRMNKNAVNLAASFFKEGKPIAVICHGASLLIETGFLKGKQLTSYKSIKTDLINSGAIWTDEEIVIDQNLITSRSPKDLPVFCARIIRELRETTPAFLED